MHNTTALSTTSQDALRSHFEACQRALEPVFFMRCWFDSVHDAVAPRFGTTVLGATVLIGLLLMWA